MKAILKNGTIHPQEPVPKDWQDGTELRVERLEPDRNGSHDDLDRWMGDVQALADQVDSEDEVILENSIREQRRQARDLARKEAEKS
jgi:hypothetical protein